VVKSSFNMFFNFEINSCLNMFFFQFYHFKSILFLHQICFYTFHATQTLFYSTETGCTLCFLPNKHGYDTTNYLVNLLEKLIASEHHHLYKIIQEEYEEVERLCCIVQKHYRRVSILHT